ncbi:MAG: hypothetical protein M1836_007112 [Candelina mexicana]|nr:MAG: hypothetical protein M1836_007112 [Candelina mexicana]
MTPIPTIPSLSGPTPTSNNITALQLSSPQSSWTVETISTVVFGIVALVVGTVTILQAHRTWKLWRRDRMTSPNTQQYEEDTALELPTRTNTEHSIQGEFHPAFEVSHRASDTTRPSAGGGSPTFPNGPDDSSDSVR